VHERHITYTLSSFLGIVSGAVCFTIDCCNSIVFQLAPNNKLSSLGVNRCVLFLVCDKISRIFYSRESSEKITSSRCTVKLPHYKKRQMPR
jgi:hypothetical protein